MNNLLICILILTIVNTFFLIHMKNIFAKMIKGFIELNSYVKEIDDKNIVLLNNMKSRIDRLEGIEEQEIKQPKATLQNSSIGRSI